MSTSWHSTPKRPPQQPHHNQGPTHSSVIWAPNSMTSSNGGQILSLLKKYTSPGTSLVVQWLRLQAPNAAALGSFPGQGTRPHMPQLKRIPQATTMTGCSQVIFFLIFKNPSPGFQRVVPVAAAQDKIQFLQTFLKMPKLKGLLIQHSHLWTKNVTCHFSKHTMLWHKNPSASEAIPEGAP